MLKNAIAESLTQLAGLVSEQLGGPAAPVTVIDDGLVALAVRRHQVGPLLFAAMANGRRPIAPALLQMLAQSYRGSVERRTSSLARLQSISKQFAARSIPWTAIKGTTQAALLYPDAAWRESADIDVLVAPRHFQCALETLIASGFVSSYPPMPDMPLLRRAILGAVHDVTLIARDDRRCAVELHRGLFVASCNQIDLLKETSTPAPDAIPAPAIGPDLAFYLIAHGALSYWVRLKWLVDLVPLFAKLSAADCLAMLNLARRAGCENSLAASLLLLRALFPFVAMDSLEPWLAQVEFRPAVQQRLRRYAEMLHSDDDQKHSPLSDAWIALEANLMFFESAPTRFRLISSAVLSSVMRRIAGRLRRSDRALTLPAPVTKAR